MRGRIRSPELSERLKNPIHLIGCALLFLSGCAVSPDPVIEELIKTRAPTFSGASSKKFTIPSQSFTLNGECDTGSKGIQYSTDRVNWSTVSSGCASDGTFSIPLVVPSFKEVYVRAKTKTGYTSSAYAWIRVLMPPTSPFFSVVTAGRTDDDYKRASLQLSMGISFQGKPVSNGAKVLNTESTGVIYGQ